MAERTKAPVPGTGVSGHGFEPGLEPGILEFEKIGILAPSAPNFLYKDPPGGYQR